MIKQRLLLFAFLFIGLTHVQADHLSDRLTFSARLQAAPGVTTNGNGVAAFMLNSGRDTLFFSISAASLSSPITGYHIHNNRTGGNVIIDFDGKVSGTTVRSFITGPTLASILADCMEGNLYVAVHTQNNPAVELLGFIKPEADWGYTASLDGSQAGTSSTGMGHASIVFGLRGDTATVRVVTQSLMGKITAVHLHYGKAGQNGGVALGLDQTIASDSLSLNGGVSISPSTWTNLMTALMADSIYINLHTTANSNGEIRGQLRTTKTLRFDSWLNQAAITAGGGTFAKASTAYGVSTAWMNNSMDTLRFNVLLHGLTSNVLFAHIHNAEPTANGGVVKDLTVNGNMISGMWTKTDASQPLTANMISELLKGHLYYVVHTDSNPGGEIRGQIYRTAREGLIGEFDGKQAMTLSRAMGTIIVTYDRDRTNLHYMAAFDGLTSPVTAAHFHKAVKGQNGGVFYDPGMPTNNGYYNYWSAAQGFNNARSLPLRRGDSIYFNVHTSNFPNGEIRAQLMRNYRISMESQTPPPPPAQDYLSDRITFSARLIPFTGVTTNGNGVAAFMLNSSRDTIYFTISTAKLSSNIVGFHIHNARTGGNVIVDFEGKVLGNTVRSFITGTDLTTMLPDFIAGQLYVAVHTQNNPAAEIFGFIKQEADWGYAASLDGAQATTSSTAKGHAAINFSLKGDMAMVRVVTSGLSGKINTAHLHYGKTGQNGGVALGLDNTIAPDSLSMVGQVSISNWTDLMTALMADSIYLNIHTGAFPNGEIRGQLMTSKNLRFDAWLNQQAILDAGGVPTAMSMAYGVSTLSLNATMDTLKYDVLFTGLTSNAVAAHFHNADANGNGAVVKELNINGNMISGMWTKTDAMEPLTNALISELLKGNLYLVVHTANNAGGEIRGQVYRTAREGLIGEINGAQAGITTGAMGTVIATYDRNRTNLHYMIAFDGLSSAVSAAHFHKAVKGQSGGVEYDLGMPVNNGFYNYWTTGFNDMRSIPFRTNDSIYVNIHTANNPNGEIRGQLMRNYRISSATMDTSTVGVQEVIVNAAQVIGFPNPAKDIITYQLESREAVKVKVILFDIKGKKVTEVSQMISSGTNKVSIDISHLNSGLYFSHIEADGLIVSKTKLIKQ